MGGFDRNKWTRMSWDFEGLLSGTQEIKKKGIKLN